MTIKAKEQIAQVTNEINDSFYGTTNKRIKGCKNSSYRNEGKVKTNIRSINESYECKVRCPGIISKHHEI